MRAAGSNLLLAERFFESAEGVSFVVNQQHRVCDLHKHLTFGESRRAHYIQVAWTPPSLDHLIGPRAPWGGGCSEILEGELASARESRDLRSEPNGPQPLNLFRLSTHRMGLINDRVK